MESYRGSRTTLVIVVAVVVVVAKYQTSLIMSIGQMKANESFPHNWAEMCKMVFLTHISIRHMVKYYGLTLIAVTSCKAVNSFKTILN